MPGQSVEGGNPVSRNGGPSEGGNGGGRTCSRGLIQAPEGSPISFPMSMVQPPTKRCHQAPTVTVSKQPPQEPKKVKPKSAAPIAEGGLSTQEGPSLTISQALGIAIPATWHPFI